MILDRYRRSTDNPSQLRSNNVASSLQHRTPIYSYAGVDIIKDSINLIRMTTKVTLAIA